MRIAIGCDEAAYDLKHIIMKHLEMKGIEVKDFGSLKDESVLYPDVAYSVASEVADGSFERGILLCGTGIGMAITANKVPGIRAAVCHDPYSTERSRKSNNCQIMTMGARVVAPELATYLLDIWLASDFSCGGSQAKVDRITELENLKK
ncbi:ribose 5-phosphate isomerase B [Proteiniclasticum ruminis]|uniref:Ribose 5-phosphate isomerase B n=1 Tax=Proteiniclasticum ruminis TaxID=398199 RepID=A0A1I4YUK1_9CLOT|nr:ribose 5-phosphate isomerase B [Proteiniclasticum ruminis]SFN41691.1 ribose 5-phosphate isomerase B [Proteiniclasticum ruminis]